MFQILESIYGFRVTKHGEIVSTTFTTREAAEKCKARKEANHAALINVADVSHVTKKFNGKKFVYTVHFKNAYSVKARTSARDYAFAHFYGYAACSGPSVQISKQMTYSNTGKPGMDTCLITMSISEQE